MTELVCKRKKFKAPTAKHFEDLRIKMTKKLAAEMRRKITIVREK
jgi:hypothetical protein